MTDIILDKALIGTKGLQLTPSGDLKTTSGVLAIFQAAQVRVLSDVTTWLQDENFGSNLRQIFKEKGSYSVTEEDIESAVTLAIKSMLDDGRISSVDSVTILDRDTESIFVEIYVTAGTQKGKVPLVIS